MHLQSKLIKRIFQKQKSITSDYANNKIIGHFDIFGDSDYVATVRYGDELIEEDIPVIDGRFEVECEIKSGIYNIQLFEVEEDDSGFGSVSYRIGDYQLHLSDVNHMSGKYFMIQRIGSYIKDVADLPLSTRYLVTDIMPIEYKRLSSVGPLYTWKYDPDDDELLSKFVYYRAVLRDFNANGEMIKICGVFLMFDNLANATEVIMFVHKDIQFCSQLFLVHATY